MERRGEGEGLESARKEGTERLPAAIHMDWNTGLKKKKEKKEVGLCSSALKALEQRLN